MPKKGGKKHNKSKNKGAGGGGASKLPDVKNIIDPGHKEDDKLLYGEGATADATTTEAAPAATASGSAISPDAASATAPPVAETAPETQEALKQDTFQLQSPAAAAVKENEAKELPVREKDTILSEPKEQRGDVKTETLAPAAPISATEAEKKKDTAKETKTTEPDPLASTRSTDRADLLTETRGQDKQATAPAATAGVPEALPETTKQDRIAPSEVGAAAITAGAAGTTAFAGDKVIQQERERSAGTGLGKTDALKETQTKPTLASTSAVQKQEDIATAAPVVAPHVKRSHEEPIFVYQDRDQPLKKPRVDDSADGSASQSLAIPGRYPSPSVAGSTASGTDSAIASEVQDAGKVDTITNKSGASGVADTAVAPKAAFSQSTASTAQTTQAVPAPSEAAVAAPAAQSAALKDTSRRDDVGKTGVVGTGTTAASGLTGAGAGAGAGAAIVADKPTAEAAPSKPEPQMSSGALQSPSATASQTQPSTDAKTEQTPVAAIPQQPQKAQLPASKEPPQEAPISQPVQLETPQKDTKKGGLMSWIRRKFKGDKTATAGNVG